MEEETIGCKEQAMIQGATIENKKVPVVPQPNDVILGRERTKKLSEWAGNKRYATEIERNTERYKNATKRSERVDIVLDIARTINKWGRFLEQPEPNGPWYVADSTKIRKKIGQALRYQMEIFNSDVAVDSLSENKSPAKQSKPSEPTTDIYQELSASMARPESFSFQPTESISITTSIGTKHRPDSSRSGALPEVAKKKKATTTTHADSLVFTEERSMDNFDGHDEHYEGSNSRCSSMNIDLALSPLKMLIENEDHAKMKSQPQPPQPLGYLGIAGEIGSIDSPPIQQQQESVNMRMIPLPLSAYLQPGQLLNDLNADPSRTRMAHRSADSLYKASSPASVVAELSWQGHQRERNPPPPGGSPGSLNTYDWILPNERIRSTAQIGLVQKQSLQQENQHRDQEEIDLRIEREQKLSPSRIAGGTSVASSSLPANFVGNNQLEEEHGPYDDIFSDDDM